MWPGKNFLGAVWADAADEQDSAKPMPMAITSHWNLKSPFRFTAQMYADFMPTVKLPIMPGLAATIPRNGPPTV
jgi:hypothetical protein